MPPRRNIAANPNPNPNAQESDANIGNNTGVGGGQDTHITLQQLVQMNLMMMQTMQQMAQNRPPSTMAEMTRAVSQHRPTQFDGRDPDPLRLENWIREFEKHFITIGCPQEPQIDQAAFSLTDTADIWRRNNRGRLRVPRNEVAASLAFGEHERRDYIRFT